MAGARVDAESVDWCSPLWVTEAAHKLWKELGGIHLDPCGNRGSQKRVRAKTTFMLPERNGLSYLQSLRTEQSLGTPRVETAFVNPPFGTSYVHMRTMELLTEKQMRERCNELATDPKKPTPVEKKLRKEFRDQYSRQTIGDWVKACADAHHYGGLEVVQIGPANTDTAAWQAHIERSSSAVLYIKGRPFFELVDPDTGIVLATGPAPMACAVAYWGANPEAFKASYKEYGAVHILRPGSSLRASQQQQQDSL